MPSLQRRKLVGSGATVLSTFGNRAATGRGDWNSGSGTWPTANLAIFCPVLLDDPFIVQGVTWTNGTSVTDNIDCGIYSIDGTLLVSTGSTARSGTNALQRATVTNILLSPGAYYLGMSMGGTTGSIQRCVPTSNYLREIYGWAQMASAFALPSTATLAAAANNFMPQIAWDGVAL